MVAKNRKKAFSVVLTSLLALYSSQILNGAQTPTGTPPSDTGSPTETNAQTASELQALGSTNRTLSRLAGGADPYGSDIPGSGCHRELLAWAKQESHREAP